MSSQWQGGKKKENSRNYHCKADRSETISQNSSSESECVFIVEVVPADNERVRATDNTLPSDFSCYSEEQDIDEINQFEFEEDAEQGDLEETLPFRHFYIRFFSARNSDETKR